MRQLFDGLHMRALPSRLEVLIAADSVDEAWQLKDVEATMSPSTTSCARSTRRWSRRWPTPSSVEPPVLAGLPVLSGLRF